MIQRCLYLRCAYFKTVIWLIACLFPTLFIQIGSRQHITLPWQFHQMPRCDTYPVNESSAEFAVCHNTTKSATKQCSQSTTCPPYKKPSAKNNSCPECIAWVTAIEAQVYPPSASGSLQWMNANSVLFHLVPLEAIKHFVLRMPAQQRNAYSALGDFDAASLLMMGKFKHFHKGDQAMFDMIQKIS